MQFKRRWLQLSLRTSLIVISAIAIWLAVKANDTRRQAEAVSAIREAGGSVCYDFEYKDISGCSISGAEPWEPTWLLDLVTINFFHEVYGVNLVGSQVLDGRDTAADRDYENVFARLEQLPDVRTLHLAKRQVTDANMTHVGTLTELEGLYLFDASELTDDGVRRLSKLANLKYLHIDNSQITDQAMEYIAQSSPNLKELVLQGNTFSNRALEHVGKLQGLTDLYVGVGACTIDDRGLLHLRSLTNLETLGIQQSRVGDAGLRTLADLPSLKNVLINGTRVTNSGTRELQRALPGVMVID